MTPEDVRNVLFDRSPPGRRGYDEDQVDAFLDLVEQALAGGRPLTTDAVRAVAFGKAGLFRRGYDERQVDAFLDRVAADLDNRD